LFFAFLGSCIVGYQQLSFVVAVSNMKRSASNATLPTLCTSSSQLAVDNQQYSNIQSSKQNEKWAHINRMANVHALKIGDEDNAAFVAVQKELGSTAPSEAEIGADTFCRLLFLVLASAFYHLFLTAVVLKGHQMNPRPFPKMFGRYAIPVPYFGGLTVVLLLSWAGFDAAVSVFRRWRSFSKAAPLVFVAVSGYVLLLGGVILREDQMDPRPIPRLSCSENDCRNVTNGYFFGLAATMIISCMASTRWNTLVTALRASSVVTSCGLWVQRWQAGFAVLYVLIVAFIILPSSARAAFLEYMNTLPTLVVISGPIPIKPPLWTSCTLKEDDIQSTVFDSAVGVVIRTYAGHASSLERLIRGVKLAASCALVEVFFVIVLTEGGPISEQMANEVVKKLAQTKYTATTQIRIMSHQLARVKNVMAKAAPSIPHCSPEVRVFLMQKKE
jgi:hypothetical protein